MILHRVAARCQFHIGEIQKATYYTAEANVTKYAPPTYRLLQTPTDASTAYPTQLSEYACQFKALWTADALLLSRTAVAESLQKLRLSFLDDHSGAERSMIKVGLTGVRLAFKPN